MKNMKFGFVGALAIAATMFFAGCSDPCKDITCTNGSCVEGVCVCDAGYEGLSCETAFNASYSGTYSLTESCTASGAAGPYSVVVAPKSSSTFDVTFVGLWEVPSNIVTAKVSATASTSFSIERQVIQTGFDIEASGGSISADGKTINLTYKIYATGSSTVTDQCTATLTK